ncbi:MAG: VCBS repeat-containing protein [Polyangiales bacterium]
MLSLAALLLAGCPEASTSSDASLDRVDVADVLSDTVSQNDLADDLPDDARFDALSDLPADAAEDADATSDPDSATQPDVTPDADAPTDASLDASGDLAPLDAPSCSDGAAPTDVAPIDPSDVPFPEAAVCCGDFDVPVQPSPDVFVPGDVVERCRVRDIVAVCTPRATSSCACVDGRSGTRECRDDGRWDFCRCGELDAGIDAPFGSTGPIPAITVPRLLAPQSGMRATSQRPTFRWVLPTGASRARVEVCADRPCTRVLMQQEVSGTSWRPTATLPPGVAFWRVRTTAEDGGVAWASATWEVGIRHRDLPADTSYGTLKDFNGDGFDDVVMLSGFDPERYMMRVYWGGATGLDGERFRGINPPFPPEETSNGYAFYGDTAGIADFDGDGLADLALSAPSYGPPGAADENGRVYLHRGSLSEGLTACDQTLTPARTSGDFGPWHNYGVSLAAGDFNGDGFGDLVAAYSRTNVVLLLGGRSGLEAVPADGLTGAGYTVQFLGDVNGDGYGDVAARTIPASGAVEYEVLILYGNPSASLSFHVQNLGRPRYYYSFGWQMAAGDFNADGYADGAFSGWGFVDVFHGSPSGVVPSTRIVTPPGTTVGTSSEGDAFGARLSAPGDIDGDGRVEFAIGAPLAPLDSPELGTGRVFMYQSTSRGVPAVWDLALKPIDNAAPFYVTTFPGDVNGDGYDDLCVGAPREGRFRPAELHVYLGSPGDWWCAPSQVIEGHPFGGFASRIW